MSRHIQYQSQNAFVVDIGSHTIKAGFAVDSMPCLITQNTPRPPDSSLLTSNFHSTLPSVLSSTLDSLVPLETSLASGASIPLIMPVDPLTPHPTLTRIAEMALTRPHVSGVMIPRSDAATLYASGRTHATVLQVGASGSTLTRFNRGSPQGSVHRGIGGNSIIRAIGEHFKLGKIDARTAQSLHKAAECAFVSFDPSFDAAHSSSALMSRNWRLPDGRQLALGPVRWEIGEALLGTGLSSLTPGAGLLAMVGGARPKGQGELVLAGGNTLLRGLPDRLELELKSMGCEQRVIAPRERFVSTWVGGAVLAGLSLAPEMTMTREGWEEYGDSLIERMCF